MLHLHLSVSPPLHLKVSDCECSSFATNFRFPCVSVTVIVETSVPRQVHNLWAHHVAPNQCHLPTHQCSGTTNHISACEREARMIILIFDFWGNPSLIKGCYYRMKNWVYQKWDYYCWNLWVGDPRCRPNPPKQKPVAEAPAPREEPPSFPEMLGPNGTLVVVVVDMGKER